MDLLIKNQYVNENELVNRGKFKQCKRFLQGPGSAKNFDPCSILLP